MTRLSIYLLALLGLVSCKFNYKDQSVNKEIVTVSILPQKYFVEKITGDRFEINVMIPPGASPVTYEPSPKQMKELSLSKVYFRIGHIEFEKSWIKKIQSVNPLMEIIDLSTEVDLIEPEHATDHSHSGHHHHGIDPHIWTSPGEVKKQADLIYQYFGKKYQEYKEFERNYSEFVKEIDSLDNYLRKELEPFVGRKFLIFHPALSYLARDYGLEQISIEIDGKEPTPANIQEIIETAKRENIRIVFVQQQFSSHNARVIADEIEGSVVQIDPLAQNWEKNLRLIVSEIVKSYANE